MKALHLDEVPRLFDPRKRLQDQLLQSWFIERAESPRAVLRVALSIQVEPQKVLFVGHRGSGKTTELSKLADEVRDDFDTIGFDILEITGRTSITYEDLMLALSTQVTRTCVQRHLLNQPLLEPVRARWTELLDWWQRVVAGPIVLPHADETDVGAKFSTLLGDIEIGVRQSAAAREAIQREIGLRMPELIRHLDWVVEQAQLAARKRLLIIVEGLDKIDQSSAAEIFGSHAATITAPNATMIYSFPISLRYSDIYRDVCLSFHENVHYFPNMAPCHHNGTANRAGITALRDLVLARLDADLIEPAALDLLIQSNGGVPIWLVRLIQKTALYALTRDRRAACMTGADAQRAIRDVRRELQAPLTSHDLEVLRARHHDRRLTNDGDERLLLYKGALIDYTNGEQWCDAHPALWALLEQEDDGGANPAT